MILQAPEFLYLLWLWPLLWVFELYGWRARAKGRLDFARPGQADRSDGRVMAAVILRQAAVLGLLLALIQPSWSPKPKTLKRRGRDIVFIIDVSRSMMAEDLAPNRLERAKIAVKDFLNAYDNHRVALIAFAGSTVLKCPLTFDHNFMRLALEDLSPESITRGGSLIGDAIRKAIHEVFQEDEDSRARDIILISDGEDHESFPQEAAALAGERGIRILSIGLGDDKRGQPIPVMDDSGQRQYLSYQGQVVKTQLKPQTLRDVAAASKGGHYLHVATGHFNLDKIYGQLIAGESSRVIETEDVLDYDAKFPIFLILALICAAVGVFIDERA